jgi:predicted 3-demethylubiquinone-9 3-methyltransferase (glyoxalase superfamily)
MQKISPFLWFDNQAEEAAIFYTSLFNNSKIINITRYQKQGAEASGRPQGSVMSVTFELEGLAFTALNGGPVFTFSPAISFFVNCESQEDVDRLWERLLEGGQEGQCGWLQDKYGISWQIVPTVLGKLLNDTDRVKAERVMKAMLQMHKLEIQALEQAYGMKS